MTNPEIRSLLTSKSRPKVTPRDTSLSLKRSLEVEEEAADKSEISDADDSAQINGEPQELQRLHVAACKHNRSGLQTRRELAQIICN